MPFDKLKKIKFSHKILILATDYFPTYSESAQAVREITDQIDTIKFDLVTIKKNKEQSAFDRIGKVNVHRFGIGVDIIDKYLLVFFGHFFVKRLHNDRQYSAIWCIGTDYASSTAANFKIKNPSIPLLLTLQDEDDPKYLRKKIGLIDPWFRQLFACPDHIHCVNARLVDWAKRMGAHCEISLVPNGINFEQFYKGKLREYYIDELKGRLNILPTEKVIITSRFPNIEWSKNIIKAIALIKQMDGISIKLLIHESIGRKWFLKREAARNDILDHVIFLNNVSQEQMPNFLWISNLYMDCSKKEVSNNSLLEAMAARVPILNIKGAIMPDFYQDRVTGFAYNPNQALSVAEKIQYVFSENVARKQVIDNGEKVAREQFSYEKIKIEIEKIFDRLFGLNKHP
ncbi:MAG: glycosyltransferase [Candidatus Falkowbacteria bacterium]|nr:glycosyltransferase [Candidatus Falkowbacteria bacterium]